MSMPDDLQPHTRTRLPVGEQPDAGTAARRPLRTVGTVLGVVLLLVAALALANRLGGSGSGGNGGGSAAAGGGSVDAASTPTAPSGTAPVSTATDGIATGYHDDAEGAQSAAVNYSVALGSSGMYTDATRHQIVQTVTDPAVTASLQATMDASFTVAAKNLDLSNGVAPAGLTFVSRPVPVGSKLDAFTPADATVEVWTNSLIGLAGTGSTTPVTSFWYTLTVRLHWVGDWKVASFSQTDGPVPVSGNQTVSTPGAISGAVNQFGGFRYAR
jgi:hypothetical protein